MAKNCVICGKPSGNYMFCFACNKLKDEGKVVKCETCGKWHRTNESCECSAKKQSIVKSENIQTTANDIPELTCITCGEPSNGKHFCPACYKKYQNKILFIKVKNCKEFDPLDAEYEGNLIPEDGHIVKSKSEMIIDNHLYSHNIKHGYELPLILDDENGKKVTLHPDFYIPDKELYIEHWGYGEENKKYTESKEYKIKLYNLNKITVICTTEEDIPQIASILPYKLKNYKIGMVNE